MKQKTFINIITMECIDDKLYQSKMEELEQQTGTRRYWVDNYYLTKVLKSQLGMNKNSLGSSYGYYNIEENKLRLSYVIIYEADENEELCKKIKLVLSKEFKGYQVNQVEEMKVTSLNAGSLLFREISNEVLCGVFDHSQIYKTYNEYIEHTTII